ncbi:MAG TPA: hypothetical protein VFO85_09145 [Vicinamibacteria bacterium]|nr:hypothetical protein [Vicinamibacteria bacterium]
MTAASGGPDGGRGVRLSRLELLAGAGFILLLAVGVMRAAMPERAPLRAVSVEGIDIPSEAIGSGDTLTREKEWRAPADVYILGWSYSLGPLQSSPELLLRHGQTVVFLGPRGGAATGNPAFLQSGLGYRLPANEPLTLRLTVTNTGPQGETQGARALIYFVPVAGN